MRKKIDRWELDAFDTGAGTDLRQKMLRRSPLEASRGPIPPALSFLGTSIFNVLRHAYERSQSRGGSAAAGRVP
jgi:hypothetical protein